MSPVINPELISVRCLPGANPRKSPFPTPNTVPSFDGKPAPLEGTLRRGLSILALLTVVWAGTGCSKDDQNSKNRRDDPGQAGQNGSPANTSDQAPGPTTKGRPLPNPSETPEDDTEKTKKPPEEKEPSPEVDDSGLPPVDLQGPIGGSRPVAIKTPVSFDTRNGKKYPLLLLLHGFGSDGEGQDRYLGLSRLALDRGYIFAAPNGTPTTGTFGRFWNATESCCNFANQRVDDVAYLRDLIRQIISRYPVDPARVYVFGHSNGAFMAHRLACEEAPRIAAIAALAGSLRPRLDDCKPKVPVGVLTIHGTADTTVRYEGGQVFPTVPAHPSAMDTIRRWAAVNECSAEPKTATRFTLLRGSNSPETESLVYDSCKAKVATEHWRIDQGSHTPAFNDQFVTRVLDFFTRQKK